MTFLVYSRILAFFLRISARIHHEPFTNVAPYGDCNTAPDALSWIPDGVTVQSCLEHDTLTRCWYTYTPSSAIVNSTNDDDDVLPVVVHLHGAGGCASLPALGWGNVAQEQGLIVVWPQGLRFPNPFIPSFIPNFALEILGYVSNSWNDGSGLFGAEANGVDDMGFLQKMVEQILVENPQVDSTRMYFSGHSNGALMAQRFALQTERIVAGVMAFSGAGMPDDELWSGSEAIPEYVPTPIVLVSGTDDRVVPFSKRRGPLPGAIPSLEGWAFINDCTDDAVVIKDMGDYKSQLFMECSNGTEVLLLEVPDTGHHAFTRGEEPFLLSPNKAIADCPFRGFPFFHEIDCRLGDVDTTSLAWDFMNRFRLPS